MTADIEAGANAAKVFIDGGVGTTGLQIRKRLEGRADIELLRLPEAARKDAGARAEMLNAADLAILCLPDDAAPRRLPSRLASGSALSSELSRQRRGL